MPGELTALVGTSSSIESHPRKVDQPARQTQSGQDGGPAALTFEPGVPVVSVEADFVRFGEICWVVLWSLDQAAVKDSSDGEPEFL